VTGGKGGPFACMLSPVGFLAAGAGRVSFDPLWPGGGGGRGKSAGSRPAGSVEFVDTSHYITQRHAGAEELKLFGPMTVACAVPGRGTVLAACGGAPLCVAGNAGKGRFVVWTSQEWMSTFVLGPVAGLDDCLWRSLVWAARKPFVMRGMAPLVTMRVDDVAAWPTPSCSPMRPITFTR